MVPYKPFDHLSKQERHNPNSPALRRLRKEAASMLAQGYRFDAICSNLGISRVTLWRWRKNEAFKKMVRELLANLNEEARCYLLSIRRNLCETLFQLSLHENPNVAFKAAAFLLNLKL
jgi:hypothetical protein